MKKIGIFGYGEIGQAIATFYKNPQIEDLKRKDVFSQLDILHVCIPYSRDFVKIVKNKIRQTGAKLVIIHSTVAIGTTKKIGEMCVHIPVRGVHPNLYESIKTFDAFIGYDDIIVGLEAVRHYKKLKIKTILVPDSRNIEALKLWDTTQYGLMIVLQKEIKKFCDKHDLDFHWVYTRANTTYNEGYRMLGRPEVVRPFLKHMPGTIGGHCVLPNCKLLNNSIAKFILSQKY